MVNDEGILRMLDAWVVMVVGGEKLPTLPDGSFDHDAISKRAEELRPLIPRIVTLDEALAEVAQRE